jgi:hypothetical protein
MGHFDSYFYGSLIATYLAHAFGFKTTVNFNFEYLEFGTMDASNFKAKKGFSQFTYMYAVYVLTGPMPTTAKKIFFFLGHKKIS